MAGFLLLGHHTYRAGQDGGVAPGSEPPLLKTRVWLRRDVAEALWGDLLRVGWKPVEAVWGPSAEP